MSICWISFFLLIAAYLSRDPLTPDPRTTQFVLKLVYKVATGEMREVDDVREDEVVERFSGSQSKVNIKVAKMTSITG